MFFLLGTVSLKKAFTRMVKEKCLIAVRPSDSLTATDRDMAEEKRETDKMTLPPTAAEMAAIRRSLGSQRDQELSKTTIVGLVCASELGILKETGIFFIFFWLAISCSIPLVFIII